MPCACPAKVRLTRQGGLEHRIGGSPAASTAIARSQLLEPSTAPFRSLPVVEALMTIDRNRYGVAACLIEPLIVLR